MSDYLVSFGIKDLIDIFCVALLLFYFYKMMKRTGSLNMFVGILVFIFVWMVVSQVLKMQLLGAILNKLVDVGVLAIIILFADDIRQFFRELGTTRSTRKVFEWLTRRKHEDDSSKWLPLVNACEDMGNKREGALIVIGANDELRDIRKTGEPVNADMNQLLIENIFFKNSPLHDGAMIIIGERIDSAACILPVSASETLPKSFGLRHRAAMGIAERTNAVAVVVSEETGKITAFHNSSFQSDLDASTLRAFISEHVR
ncbi:MAG: diadenylate cyclase CdaA [Bacteroidaceae bacterium]|nr:diadenylate cyclase CdaA [Bacteroidaceae bacterium]